MRHHFHLLLTLAPIFHLLYSTQAADYFEYKKQFRPCTLLQFKSLTSKNAGGLESVPPGYTFFTAKDGNVTYEVKSLEDQCKAKHCHDGPFQQECKSLESGDQVDFQNSFNETLICICESDVPEILQDHPFDRNHTGAVFSPYVKNWSKVSSDGTSVISKWNNYTLDEVKSLISILATKFKRFSTYGIGATSTSRSWDGGDSTGLVPVATAQINHLLVSKGLSPLTILQGIYQNEYNEIRNQEIRNALTAARDANAIFPGTVIGLIFTSDYVTNNATANEVCSLLDQYRNETKELKLEVGVRLKSCTDIIPTKLPEADNHLHSLPGNYTYAQFQSGEPEFIFQNLLKRVDFIICSNPPPAFLVDEAMEDVVMQYGSIFLKIQELLRGVKPNLTVIAQGGWASWGVSRNGATNNVTNMVEFWNRMDAWAHEHSFLLDMFESFDEPWKTDVNDRSSASGGPSGPVGAEGNYGWWKRYDSASGNFYTYVPKVQELESVYPETDNLKTTAGMDSVTLALVTVIVGVLGLTGFLVWRLKKSRKTSISAEALEMALEFRNGLALSSESVEKLAQKSDEGMPLDMMESNGGKSYIFALRFPYDKKYELDKKSFTVDEDCVLGVGNYGTVYKGEIHGVVTEAAFKTLNSNGSIIELKNLLSEIKIMAYVGQHPNILMLIGAYTAKIEHGVIYVATEFCGLGSLEKYLRAQRPNYQDGSQPPAPAPLPALNYVMAFIQSDPIPSSFIIPQKSLTLADLLKWAYEIACGMEHIANKKVVHSDLATRNVLLTSDGTAKVADFGLSRQLYYHTNYLKSNRNEELPWRWMSVESLRSLVFSTHSDVWTFGVTLWEILSLAQLPYPGVPGWTPSFLHELEANDYRMEPPPHGSPQMYELMLKCWAKDPVARPTFTSLKETLLLECQKQSQHSNGRPI